MVANALGWAALWLLALFVLGAVAFPLMHRLMPGLPSRGVAMSPALGLLLVSYVAWLLASVHLMPFGRGALLLAVALDRAPLGVVGDGLAAARRSAGCGAMAA